MANQMVAVSNNPRLRVRESAKLAGRMPMLTQIIANKQRQEDIDRQQEQFNRSFGQAERQLGLDRARFASEQEQFKKSQALQRRQQQIGMGLEAAKLGLTTSKDFGGKTLGDLSKNVTKSFGAEKNIFSGTPGVSNFDAGSAVSGGLLGFGASALIPGKNKALKAGVGALAGGLSSFLGGGSFISGSLGGALGGFGGSLFG